MATSPAMLWCTHRQGTDVDDDEGKRVYTGDSGSFGERYYRVPCRECGLLKKSLYFDCPVCAKRISYQNKSRSHVPGCEYGQRYVRCGAVQQRPGTDFCSTRSKDNDGASERDDSSGGSAAQVTTPTPTPTAAKGDQRGGGATGGEVVPPSGKPAGSYKKVEEEDDQGAFHPAALSKNSSSSKRSNHHQRLTAEEVELLSTPSERLDGASKAEGMVCLARQSNVNPNAHHRWDKKTPHYVNGGPLARFRCLHCGVLSRLLFFQCKCGKWLYARKARSQQKCDCIAMGAAAAAAAADLVVAAAAAENNNNAVVEAGDSAAAAANVVETRNAVAEIVAENLVARGLPLIIPADDDVHPLLPPRLSIELPSFTCSPHEVDYRSERIVMTLLLKAPFDFSECARVEALVWLSRRPVVADFLDYDERVFDDTAAPSRHPRFEMYPAESQLDDFFPGSVTHRYADVELRIFMTEDDGVTKKQRGPNGGLCFFKPRQPGSFVNATTQKRTLCAVDSTTTTQDHHHKRHDTRSASSSTRRHHAFAASSDAPEASEALLSLGRGVSAGYAS